MRDVAGLVPRFIGADEIARLSFVDAADALELALRGGLDAEAQPGRTAVEAGAGELLLMPASTGEFASVKVVSIGGSPWVQGVCVVFDTVSLTPVAVLDGAALTELRTPAVSLLAIRHLVRTPPERVVVFGSGTQAMGHARAIRQQYGSVDIVHLGRSSSPEAVATELACADVICCATTAVEPLFDGARVKDDAAVVAVGSHRPHERELDSSLVQRSVIVVESRDSALVEAGDLIMAGIGREHMLNLGELVHDGIADTSRPRIFKSTGMSWEDTVVAGAIVRAGTDSVSS
jgi:ornithine cyclodeaminase